MSSVLQVQQFYTAGIPLLEAYLLATIELTSENKMTASHVVQIHMCAFFLLSKKWLTYHVAVPTGNTLALQRGIFNKNRLNFRPSSAAEKVAIVSDTNNHVKSEMLCNRYTQTDTQAKYCNPHCTCMPRVNNY